MNTFISIVQIITCVTLVILMAVQTDKAEQSGGVMGLGASAGRTTEGVDMAVGAERILKPLTVWVAFGFIASSLLNIIPNLTWIHVVAVLAIYVALMKFGGRIWSGFTGIFGRV